MGYCVDELLFSKETILEKVRDFHPDIVLMDRNDGEEGECKVVQWMRNEVDVPVVQLISSVEKNSVDLMNMDDLSDYVLKPVNEMDLRYSIEIAWYKHELNKKIGMNGENFSKLINNVDELVFSINSEYKITNWNSSIEQMSGYAFNDVDGKEIDRLGIFDQVDEIKRVVDDVCHGDAKAEETQLVCLFSNNGDKKMIAVRPPRVVYDDHHCVSVVFIGRDITYQYERVKDLKEGNGYLLIDGEMEALSLLKSVATLGYKSVIFTCSDTTLIRNVLSPYPIQIVSIQFGERGKIGISDIDDLLASIKKRCGVDSDVVVFLSGFEVFLSVYSFDRILQVLDSVIEIICSTYSFFLLHISDSMIFSEKQLRLFQSKLRLLPSNSLRNVFPDLRLFDLLLFLHKERKRNNAVSFTDLRKELKVSFPTVRKHVRHLEENGFVNIVRNGKRKIVFLSENGVRIVENYGSYNNIK